MEEANVSKRHSDAVLVAGINNMIVTGILPPASAMYSTPLL